MALLIPFCNLISLFSSISNHYEAEQALWDEIWGCVNYIKIPYDTIMNMPVYIRKFWIKKHNEANNISNTSNQNKTEKNISGIAINSYAEMEQNNFNATKR